MAVSRAGCVQPVDSIVGVKVKQESFELRNLAVLRDVHLGQSVDRPHPMFHGCEMLGRHGIALVNHEHIGVRYLQMRGCHVGTFVLVAHIRCGCFVKA